MTSRYPVAAINALPRQGTPLSYLVGTSLRQSFLCQRVQRSLVSTKSAIQEALWNEASEDRLPSQRRFKPGRRWPLTKSRSVHLRTPRRKPKEQYRDDEVGWSPSVKEVSKFPAARLAQVLSSIAFNVAQSRMEKIHAS